MTDETTSLSFLLSGTTLLLGFVGFYVGRSLWIARNEWRHCRTDTKILYLLVAPVLTLAVDVLSFTDRLFWSRSEKNSVRSPKPAMARARLSPRVAGRTDR